MKKVTCFIEPDWAFGSIHYELCKYFFRRGINCNVLAWNRSYSLAEMQELDDTTDIYLTNPHGYRHHVYTYQVNKPEKFIVVAHAKSDLEELIEYHGKEEYLKPRHFAVTSNFLKSISVEKLGIPRIPIVLDVGINVNSFISEPSKKLETLGYAGTASVGYHQPIKRSHLVEQAAKNSGLNYLVAQSYHNSFVTMPGFYQKVDCVMVASTEEGAGLPVLEASAAGKLVISTPVGHWCERQKNSGGFVVPISEPEFLQQVKEILDYYRDNPAKYQEKCWEIQNKAKQYDWENYIDQWVNLINN